MPLAHSPPVSTPTALAVAPTGISLQEGVSFSAGQAIALVEISGSKEYRLAGCNTYADSFFGFMETPVSGDGASKITTGRGSVITPVVEYSQSLTPGEPVYLATTPGQVTPVAPSGSGDRVVRLGTAISLTQFVFMVDVGLYHP